MILAGLIAAIALGAPAGEEPVSMSVWAVQATQEGHSPKQFEAGLESIRGAVADLPFDTYRKVQALTQTLPAGQETRVAIDARYTLFLKPLDTDPEGRIRLEVRVELAPKAPQDKPVTALSTRLALAPGKQAKVGGFKLEQGELVIVLSPGK